MPDVQFNYQDIEELVDSLHMNALAFETAAVNVGKVLALVHDDGLDGKAGQQMRKSLQALQSKLTSANTEFDKLADEVRAAAREMQERDGAAKF